jgi:hypothetical protein
VIRVVPRVEREEFVNAGVIVSCPEKGFLEARVELDEARLLALDPHADLAAIRAHLESIPRVAAGGGEAGPIGALSPRERSTAIQVSPAHSGRCEDPAALLEHLMQTMVRPLRR